MVQRPESATLIFLRHQPAAVVLPGFLASRGVPKRRRHRYDFLDFAIDGIVRVNHWARACGGDA